VNMQMTDEQFSRNKTKLQKKRSKTYKPQTAICSLPPRLLCHRSYKASKNYTKSRSVVRLSGITFPTTLRDAHYLLQLKETKAHDEWNKYRQLSTFSFSTSIFLRSYSFYSFNIII